MRRMDFMIEQKTYEILRAEAFKNRKSIGAVVREMLAARHAETGEKEAERAGDTRHENS